MKVEVHVLTLDRPTTLVAFRGTNSAGSEVFLPKRAETTFQVYHNSPLVNKSTHYLQSDIRIVERCN